MTITDWADSNRYLFSHGKGGAGSGYKLHLVEPKPYNNRALCGVQIAGVREAPDEDFIDKFHVCRNCEKEAKDGH